MSLPPVRRVVTAYNAQGLSVFAEDNHVNRVGPPAGSSKTQFSPLWGTTELPSKNQLVGGLDGASTLSSAIVNPRGSTFRIVDTAAGTESPHHRTESLDYVIMLNGEVTLELENGKKTVLKAGDVAIQQGTLHKWINHTEAPARFACVALGTEQLSVPGVELAGPTFA